jgi:hypothetical protein
MSKAQLDTLWGYQNRTGARTVKVNSWMISLGMDYTNQASSDGIDQFEFVTGAPLGVSGVNPAAKFDLATITRCGGRARPSAGPGAARPPPFHPPPFRPTLALSCLRRPPAPHVTRPPSPAPRLPPGTPPSPTPTTSASSGPTRRSSRRAP